ncbi:MAG: hypothetical protein KDE66_06135 [Nitrosomonas sp.]|nr:hypothetical protein [Nitrosomonas sp.]
MSKNFYSIIMALFISASVLGGLFLVAFPDANSTFGLILFFGYLTFALIYGPSKSYMGYPSKKAAS